MKNFERKKFVGNLKKRRGKYLKRREDLIGSYVQGRILTLIIIP
jgi:hypothetical protein